MLEESDIDTILASLPLGTRRLVKLAWAPLCVELFRVAPFRSNEKERQQIETKGNGFSHRTFSPDGPAPGLVLTRARPVGLWS